MTDRREALSTISEIDQPKAEAIGKKRGFRLLTAGVLVAVVALVMSVAVFVLNLEIGRAVRQQVQDAHVDGLLTWQLALTVLAAVLILADALFIALAVRRPLARMASRMRSREAMQAEGVEELRALSRAYNEIVEEHKKTTEYLTYEAMHDGLTGVLNRNAYELLYRDTDLAHAALLIIDVDNFKHFNNTYGHDMGDRVLKRVAEVIQHSFRSVDLIYRYGGDEFVVIMTRANSSMKDLVLGKIEQANRILQDPHDGLPPISLSVGVAFCDRKNPQGDLLKDADTALYRVKKAGRNGCEIY